MYFITTKRMLEVCFSAHPNIQYRTFFSYEIMSKNKILSFCEGSYEIPFVKICL